MNNNLKLVVFSNAEMLGKKVDDSVYYTVGVATAGKDAVAAQASVG